VITKLPFSCLEMESNGEKQPIRVNEQQTTTNSPNTGRPLKTWQCVIKPRPPKDGEPNTFAFVDFNKIGLESMSHIEMSRSDSVRSVNAPLLDHLSAAKILRKYTTLEILEEIIRDRQQMNSPRLLPRKVRHSVGAYGNAGDIFPSGSERSLRKASNVVNGDTARDNALRSGTPTSERRKPSVEEMTHKEHGNKITQPIINPLGLEPTPESSIDGSVNLRCASECPTSPAHSTHSMSAEHTQSQNGATGYSELNMDRRASKSKTQEQFPNSEQESLLQIPHADANSISNPNFTDEFGI